ncbi:hypothetical protein HNV08_10450 [Winogradskyella eckloniae]|uniref:hypothetical protein n=1 Tax=Winogradskyella eckloniae TaxID=1089306 RepID=UPI001566DC56|nr:hypothetical protein [Winogradskyella eckloniae]NRD20467.1 hypothetical protein [Winogradskyella eckloniae]
MKKSFIKMFTIILFISLIVSFICYRSGYFDKSEESNKNEISNSNDSIVKIETISSSKSLILIDHYKKKDTTSKDTLINIKPLIYSSKSGVIFSTKDLILLNKDSISIDSMDSK